MIKLIVIFALILSINGCATYAGVAMSDQKYSGPEVNLDNPIGILGGSIRVGNFDLFLEHHSGIFKTEEGFGYNLSGIKYYLTNGR